MNFKSYLNELHNIEVGQAIEAHEPTDEASSSVVNPRVITQVNKHLSIELGEMIFNPIDGFNKVRKVMHRYGFDLPALYDPEDEGNEVVFDVKQYGQAHGPTILGDIATGTQVIDMNPDAYLYVLYYLTDDGYYDFFAEIMDEERLEEVMSEDEDLEEDE